MDITQQLNALKPFRAKWTLEIFLQAAKIVHGDKYDYSKVTEEHMTSRSLLPLTCKLCGYEWTPRLDNHIGERRRCNSCVGIAPWTLERFIQRSVKIYGPDTWDYSQINVVGKIGSNTRVHLICKKCKYPSTPRIVAHVNGKRRCRRCFGWTLEKFLVKAKAIHGDKFDYSKIKKEHVEGRHSKIPVSCKTCHTKWFPTIDNHIRKTTGCSGCASSKGESTCAEILTSLGIEYSREYRLKNSRRCYDFHFVHNSKEYLLEYDGIQHFERSKMFHRSTDDFYEKQEVDISKTKASLEKGFVMIRIDHIQLGNIEYHINQALDYDFSLYVSDEDMYDYILSPIIDEQ